MASETESKKSNKIILIFFFTFYEKPAWWNFVLCFGRYIWLKFFIYFMQITIVDLNAWTGKIMLRTQLSRNGVNKQRVGL